MSIKARFVWFITLLSFSLIFFKCSPTTEESAVVNFILPQGNAVFLAGSEMIYRFSAADSNGLDQVKISIGRTIGQSALDSTAGYSFTDFSYFFVVDSIVENGIQIQDTVTLGDSAKPGQYNFIVTTLDDAIFLYADTLNFYIQYAFDTVPPTFQLLLLNMGDTVFTGDTLKADLIVSDMRTGSQQGVVQSCKISIRRNYADASPVELLNAGVVANVDTLNVRHFLNTNFVTGNYQFIIQLSDDFSNVANTSVPFVVE